MIGIQQFGFRHRFHALAATAGTGFMLFDFLLCMNTEIIFRLLRLNRFDRAADLCEKQNQPETVKNLEALQPHAIAPALEYARSIIFQR